MNRVHFRGAMRPSRALRMHDHAYRRRPRARFDRFEVCGIVSLVIGAALLVGILAGWL